MERHYVIRTGAITFLYPYSSMEKLSKMKRIEVKYEKIGIENPTVGIASS